MKKSLPVAIKFSGLKPRADKLYTEKKAKLEEVKVVRAVVDQQNAEIEKLRAEMETIKEQQQDTRGEADKITIEIDKISEDLSKLFEKKDEVREVYWKARFDFEVQKEEIMYIEWMMRQKDRVVNREQENKQIVEDRENLIKDLPHPYEKEIDTCDHLIGYITEIKRKAGLI